MPLTRRRISSTSAPIRQTLAIELTNSHAFSASRPLCCRKRKSSGAVNMVSFSMSYSRPVSCASLMTVPGERRLGISGRMSAS